MTSAESLLINKVLNDALERQATDIHLTVGNYPVMRVAGNLVVMTDEQVLNPELVTRLVETFLSEADRQILEREREVTVVYNWADRARFRIQVFYQKGYPALSLRLVPQHLPTPKDLGLSSVLINTTSQARGLVLIVGPYKSGRTTSAFSLLDYVNQQQGKHILTLEKPIEYLMVNDKSIIEQREVGRDVPSFNQGLKFAAEEDFDIILVGDLQEDGQEDAVIQTVESGKLVYLVMSAQSVITALEEFVSRFPQHKAAYAREALSDNLLVATSQRLVPAVDGSMALAYEIVINSSSVKNNIKEGTFYQLNNIMLTSRQEGMISLDRQLADLVKAGKIAPNVATNYAVNQGAFKQMIGH